MKILLILFSTLMMNACGCQKKSVDNNMKSKIAATTQQEKLSGTYIVQIIGNDKVDSQKVTLNFNPQRNAVTGFSGCNTYSGYYTEQKGTIKFNNIRATEMSCEEGSKTEKMFMDALSQVITYEVKRGKLILKSSKGTVLEAKSKFKRAVLNDNEAIVTYIASTRGYFSQLVLHENKLLVRSDRNSKIGEVIAVSDKDMDEVKTLISEIDLQNIDKIESPTKKRLYDGAPFANITIIQKGKTYKGAGFDGGYPPKELAALVNKIISLSQKK